MEGCVPSTCLLSAAPDKVRIARDDSALRPYLCGNVLCAITAADRELKVDTDEQVRNALCHLKQARVRERVFFAQEDVRPRHERLRILLFEVGDPYVPKAIKSSHMFVCSDHINNSIIKCINSH